MKAFNVKAARADGLSDAEIADLIAQDYGIDLSASRGKGMADAEILKVLVDLDRRTVRNNQEAARNKAVRPMVDPASLPRSEQFALGVGSGMSDLALGASQVLGLSDRRAADAKDEADRALMDTGAGFAGNITGKVVPTLAIPFGAASQAAGRPIQAAGMLANSGRTVKAGTAISGSGLLDSVLVGMGLGGLEPVGEGESRAANVVTGGIIGGTVPAVVGTARGIRGAAMPFTEAGQERIASDALVRMSSNPAAARAALATSRPLVPGSMPTTAAVTRDYGLASAERTARGLDPAGFAAIDTANNAARLRALEGIAGTPDDVIAAEAARRSAAIPLLREAQRVSGGQVDNTNILGAIDTVLSGPARKREGVSNALRFIRDKVDDPNLSFDDLYAIRKELDDLMTGKMAGAEKFTGVREATRELNAIKRQIDQSLNAASGGKFGQYTRTWAAGSRPIEQMQAGQEILEKAGSRARNPVSGDPIVRAPDIRSYLTRKGENRFGPVFSDEQKRVLENIASDAERGNIVDVVRPRGSDTFQNLAQDSAFRAATGRQDVPEWMRGTIGKITRAIYGSYDDRIAQRVVEALQNPEKAAVLLAYAPDEASRTAIQRYLSEVSQARLPQAVTAGQLSADQK